MGLVSANCPNCGASIQVSNEHENVFCMYCGSQISVQKAIQTVKIDKSGNLTNLLMIAEENLITGQFNVAKRQIQKALEIDNSCAKAWVLNMYCIAEVIYNDPDYRCYNFVNNAINTDENIPKQILHSGNNAIKYSSDPAMLIEVNTAYINIISCYISTIKEVYENIDWIRERLNTLREMCYPDQILLWGGDKHKIIMRQEDSEALNMPLFIDGIAMKLVDGVNKDALIPEQYERLSFIATQYLKTVTALKKRYKLYNHYISTVELNKRVQFIRAINSLIPETEEKVEDKKEKIEGNSIQANDDGTVIGGCLVVTIIIAIAYFGIKWVISIL